MAETAPAPGSAPKRALRVFMETQRKDAWWRPQLATAALLSTFIVYATWAAFQGEHYTAGPYLSPFYSPELFGPSPHAWFGPAPSWWPGFLPFSAALLILPFPAGFRATCYYYRGAYYKAFWADPPGCAVGEPRKSYLGENALPLILQNVHRYFMYIALAFLVMLSYDVYLATQFEDGFGIGVGTLVLATNVALLTGYTFGCHSMRHLVSGSRRRLPTTSVGKTCYECVSGLNSRHMNFAWASLISVGLSDVYVRLCSMGIITDFRFF